MTIILDLPAPPSVNRTRKVDWRAGRKFAGWTRTADALVLAAKCRAHNPIKLNRIPTFDLRIILSETHTKIDLDNGIKWLIDYLRKIELIEDDGPKHLRRLVVEWGSAPEGVRVEIHPWPIATRAERFLQWAKDIFGPIAGDRTERVARFLEEAIELAHCEGFARRTLDRIADRVFARPHGSLAREIGQAQATLECLAENVGVSADEECAKEFQRVQSIPQSEWAARHAAKCELGIAAQ